jgi:hypothetical protein
MGVDLDNSIYAVADVEIFLLLFSVSPCLRVERSLVGQQQNHLLVSKPTSLLKILIHRTRLPFHEFFQRVDTTELQNRIPYRGF